MQNIFNFREFKVVTSIIAVLLKGVDGLNYHLIIR